MSLETRRQIISLMVIMDESELQELLACARKVYDRRMVKHVCDVQGRR